MNNFCTLCAELSGERENNLCLVVFGKKINRVIFETMNFIVLPSIGPIVEGHLLIVSKKHYLCMGALSSKLFLELGDLKRKIRTCLWATYGKKSISFEHGSVGNSFQKKAGCCTDHAHLHIVPANVDLLPQIKSNFVSRKINSISDLRKNWKNKTPYLFYENNAGKLFTFDVTFVASQYLRIILAKELGLNNWDWRKNFGKTKMLNTIKNLKKVLE